MISQEFKFRAGWNSWRWNSITEEPRLPWGAVSVSLSVAMPFSAFAIFSHSAHSCLLTFLCTQSWIFPRGVCLMTPLLDKLVITAVALLSLSLRPPCLREEPDWLSSSVGLVGNWPNCYGTFCPMTALGPLSRGWGGQKTHTVQDMAYGEWGLSQSCFPQRSTWANEEINNGCPVHQGPRKTKWRLLRGVSWRDYFKGLNRMWGNHVEEQSPGLEMLREWGSEQFPELRLWTVRAPRTVISEGGVKSLLALTFLGKNRGIHRYPGLSSLPSSALLPWLPLAKHSWGKETIDFPNR